MRRFSLPLLAIVLIFSGLVLSCVSTSPGKGVAAAGQKVKKERQVTIKTPVLVKETSYYADGLLDAYITYTYDASKKFLLEKDSFDGARTLPVERVVSDWKAGLLVADTVYDQDGKVKLRHDYGYDATGRLVSDAVTDGKGQSASASTYAYDKAGNKIEWRAFDATGVLKAVTGYSYGPPAASGSAPLSLIDLKNSAGLSTGTIRYSYDQSGRLLGRDYLAADGSTMKSEVFVYASPSGPAASLETRRADGSLASKTVYDNGDLGQILKSTESDGSGAVRGFKQYEYTVREDTVTETYYE